MNKAHQILLCGMLVLLGHDCLGAEAPTLNAEQTQAGCAFRTEALLPQSGSKRIQDGSWRISSKRQSRNGSRRINKNRENNRTLEF